MGFKRLKFFYRLKSNCFLLFAFSSDVFAINYRFRSKYHPEEFEKRKLEQNSALKTRLSVFLDLLNNQWIDSVSVDVEKSNQIIRLLDAAVIKLEGGTDFDLKALDETVAEEKPTEPDLSLFAVEDEKPPKTEANKGEREAGEESDSDDNKDNDVSDVKQNNGDDTNDGNEKANSSEEPNKPENISQDSVGSMEEGEASMDAHSESKVTLDDDKRQTENVVKTEEKTESPTKVNANTSNSTDTEKPRPLHKTLSIFIRNLAPTITKQEVEEVMFAFIHKSLIFLTIAMISVMPTLPRIPSSTHR